VGYEYSPIGICIGRCRHYSPSGCR